MANLFERLGQSPPPTQTKFGANGLTLELQALHHWLQNWSKPTIRLRDICNRGPEFARKRERAIHLTERLVEAGWLAPVEARRRNRKEWLIVRGQGGYPTVATMNTAARIETHFTPLQSD
jgi:hypothetical protein